MKTGLLLSAIVLISLSFSNAEAAPSYSQDQRALLSKMIAETKRERWVQARQISFDTGLPEAHEAYEWLRLRQPGIEDFQRYKRWLDTNRGWPDEARIQRKAEEILSKKKISPTQTIGFFYDRAPVSGTGATRYAEALVTLGQRAEALIVARDAWLKKDLTRDDENRLLSMFREELSGLHDERLDRLIWNIRLTAASRHLRNASPDARRIGNARIALLRGKGAVDSLIQKIPAAQRNHPGLAYARMVWRKKRGLRDSSEDLLIQSSKAQNLGLPDKWADERISFVRSAISRGEHGRAYELAVNHGLDEGADFADLEWLAGWLSLRKLNNPERAIRHFDRLFKNVETPVSKARGAFWAGEAAAALGKNTLGDQWYKEATNYPSAFYGQVARARIGLSQSPDIPAPVALEQGGCVNDRRVDLGSALAAGGDLLNARLFFYSALERCETVAEAKALATQAEKLGAFRVSVGLGRKMRGKSIFMPEIANPVISFPEYGCSGNPAPERALTLAIARQESGFDHTARSRAGALGLMQVMPGTARLIARDAGVSYSKSRLGSDRNYNARIGQCYLSQLIDRFEGSYPLVLAAYNAGPSRVQRWVKENGDPREGEIDTIEWIERIPFKETRNYVQRVLESLTIYRVRISG